jgi:hypothetical protein
VSARHASTFVLLSTFIRPRDDQCCRTASFASSASELILTNCRGAAGDELEDIRPNMANARRRSNSSTHDMKDFKTKFETVEIEPVFEEELHGPMSEELEKQSTTSTDKSVDEEEHDKKL